MTREEVHRLQSRVDVLEQVRLGWGRVWPVPTSPIVSGAAVPSHGMVGGFMGKGCRESGFLTMPGSTVWDSPAWEEPRFRVHLACYIHKDSSKCHQATGPMALLACLWGPGTL